jgi:hypothetical protein
MLILTLIIDLILMSFSGFGIYMLVRGAKEGSVMIGGKYGVGSYTKAAQPIRYWLGMAYYISWILFCFYGLYARNLELIKTH